jgi:hypothetical protein
VQEFSTKSGLRKPCQTRDSEELSPATQAKDIKGRCSFVGRKNKPLDKFGGTNGRTTQEIMCLQMERLVVVGAEPPYRFQHWNANIFKRSRKISD